MKSNPLGYDKKNFEVSSNRLKEIVNPRLSDYKRLSIPSTLGLQKVVPITNSTRKRNSVMKPLPNETSANNSHMSSSRSTKLVYLQL